MNYMINRLQFTLAQFVQRIGKDYENLGKTVGFGSKIYLYYSENGWEVKKLKLIQRIVRFIFKAYKDTHLKTITKQLSQESNLSEIKNLPIFLKKIQQLWDKTYKKQQFPLDIPKLENPYMMK